MLCQVELLFVQNLANEKPQCFPVKEIIKPQNPGLLVDIQHYIFTDFFNILYIELMRLFNGFSTFSLVGLIQQTVKVK